MAIDYRLQKYISNQLTYNDNDVIIAEGEPGEKVHILLDGKAKLLKTGPKGTLILARLEEGSVFGESSLLQNRKVVRPFSIVAVGSVTVGILDMDMLQREFDSIPELIKTVISNLSKKLDETNSYLSSIYLGLTTE